jgi:hypothetical protein
MRTTTILAWVISGVFAANAGAEEAVREPAGAAPRETAERTTVQPIEVQGTISHWDDDVLSLTTKASVPPVQYHFSKTTQWVDAAGNLVTRDTLKIGTPVTLYYTKTADGLVITKVVVRKDAAPIPPPATTVVEKRETIATTEIQPLQATGVVTTWGDGTLTLRVEGAAVPVQYLFGDTTQWFDEAGQTVTRDMLRVGMPATVVYTRGDQRLVASKIVLTRPPTAVIAEPQETVVERRAPKAIEKHEEVVKEKSASKAPPKRKAVVAEKSTPKVTEHRKKEVTEPIITEPIVERKTTTTTTTTRKKGDKDED